MDNFFCFRAGEKDDLDLLSLLVKEDFLIDLDGFLLLEVDFVVDSVGFLLLEVDFVVDSGVFLLFLVDLVGASEF